MSILLLRRRPLVVPYVWCLGLLLWRRRLLSVTGCCPLAIGSHGTYGTSKSMRTRLVAWGLDMRLWRSRSWCS
jgi:hypothetical protein